ncbi:MAG: hypothetical protein ACMG6H_17415, partial [Acidobacteriota bacterium]
MTIEPRTGELVIYVPNANSDERGDRRAAGDIDQLIEINTPGTAFMPVAFLAWFDRLGKAPMSTLWDTNPVDVPNAGTITNSRADAGSEGLISARAALAGMQEVPAFRAANEVGVDAILDIAAKLGITTLAMNFDPNWLNHADATYGPTLGNAGVNIRAIDMAYVNATLANMGIMVGTPPLAAALDVSSMESTGSAEGQDYDEAIEQRRLFQRGDTRLPGTRELDPIVVLKVSDSDGNVLFAQGEPERQRVVDAGSVWLLHTIMSDCTARFIIWACGRNNLDLSLDFALSNGRLVPAGVQFGRMAFPPDPTGTLEVWMAGYSRYAATVLWVGNADNSLVHDGPRHGYAASTTAVRLWKTWMGSYHDRLQARGQFTAAAGFADLQPPNVIFGPFRTTSTDRGLRSGGAGTSTPLCER